MLDPLQSTERMMFRGFTKEAAEVTLDKIHHQSADEIKATLKAFNDGLADDATKCDVLAEMRLNIKQRASAIEEISPTCQREDAPASAHNTRRLLLKDQCEALYKLRIIRKEDGRDHCVPAEQEEAKKAEAQATEERVWKHMGLLRDKGYYYVPGVDMCQPECNLDPEIVAARDAIRLRHLPRSPYEDRILAEYYGATFPVEKDINAETLLKEEMECDEYTANVKDGFQHRRGYHEPQDKLTARLIAERIRVRNELQSKAEAKLDEIDRTKGKIWACPCCRENASPPWGWQDEPEHWRATSQWRVPATGWGWSIKSLLWATIVGWLITQQLCATALPAPRAPALTAPRATALPPFASDRLASHPAKPCRLAGDSAGHDFAGPPRAAFVTQRTQSRGTVAVTITSPNTLKREHQLTAHPPPHPFFPGVFDDS